VSWNNKKSVPNFVIQPYELLAGFSVQLTLTQLVPKGREALLVINATELKSPAFWQLK